MLLKPFYRKLFLAGAFIWLVNVTLMSLEMFDVLQVPLGLEISLWTACIFLAILIALHMNYLMRRIDRIAKDCCVKCDTSLAKVDPDSKDVKCPACGATNTRAITRKEFTKLIDRNS